jgi:glycosyltransferase involved in cell wall biosynthesis
MHPTLSIGILGTRGIPNAYGGFEQFAQFLSVGLVERGHKVWVYNSKLHPYQQSNFKGVNIIHCNDWENRIGTAGQFIYDYNCIKDAGTRNFDILLQLGYTSNSIWYSRWPKKPKNIINMDGLEWQRNKYNGLTKKFLKYAERLAAKHANVLIADSIGIQKYIKAEYRKDAIHIPYGANLTKSGNLQYLQSYNINPNKFHLLIARMEPENNIEVIIQGYLASNQNMPLVIVGNYQNKFGLYLRKKYENQKIQFIGAIYDQSIINSLRFYCAVYFHGHSVGGTNPSLLEAMGCGCKIIAHDNIFNRAILNNDAHYFKSAEDIRKIFNNNPNTNELDQFKKNNLQKIETLYSWNRIIESYEHVFVDSLEPKERTRINSVGKEENINVYHDSDTSL